MADTKQTKTVGEHHVAAELARRGWAPALTRDGVERTDILAVDTLGSARRQIEVQVKATRSRTMSRVSWPIGGKAQVRSAHPREYFVLVAIPDDDDLPLRDFVVPRSRVAAAAWISHTHWRTEPGIPPGQRNAPVDRSRVSLKVFERYEGRWDLLPSTSKTSRSSCHLSIGSMPGKSVPDCHQDMHGRTASRCGEQQVRSAGPAVAAAAEYRCFAPRYECQPAILRITFRSTWSSPIETSGDTTSAS